MYLRSSSLLPLLLLLCSLTACGQKNRYPFRNPVERNLSDFGLRGPVKEVIEHWERDSAVDDATQAHSRDHHWRFSKAGLITLEEEIRPIGESMRLVTRDSLIYQDGNRLIAIITSMGEDGVVVNKSEAQLAIIYKNGQPQRIETTDAGATTVKTFLITQTRTGTIVHTVQPGRMERRKTFMYDTAGRLTSLNEQLYIDGSRWEDSTLTRYTYNPQGQVMQKHIYWADHSQDESGDYIVQLSYNKQGDLLRESYASGRSKTYDYSYDARGNWIRKTETEMSTDRFSGQPALDDKLHYTRTIHYW